MPTYRPTMTVEAVQFTGSNRSEVLAFAYPSLSREALEAADIIKLPVVITLQPSQAHQTLVPGDWVVHGHGGSVFVRSAADFQGAYELVPERAQGVSEAAP